MAYTVGNKCAKSLYKGTGQLIIENVVMFFETLNYLQSRKV